MDAILENTVLDYKPEASISTRILGPGPDHTWGL